MGDENLFKTEIEVIKKARQILDRKGVAPGPSRREYQWLLDRYVRLCRQSRRLVSFSDRMQDELNRLNQQLCRSEAKYRNIFENATQGIFRCGPTGRIIEVNAAMARMLGHATPEDMLRENRDARALENQEGYQRLVANVKRKGQCRQYQTELVRRDGCGIWVEFSAQLFQDDTGGVSHIDGLLADVTERKRLHEELTRQAHTDELTGLLNRRRFIEMLEQEILRAARLDTPLSLIMIDIDFFKSVNDHFGHDTGDQVLQRITAACRKALREKDLFGRLGGEEFAVILPGMPQVRALKIAERLRNDVENEPICTGQVTIRKTVSIGLCQFGGEITGMEALIKAADSALYRAKQKGRNRVCIHRYRKGDKTQRPRSAAHALRYTGDTLKSR